MQTAAVAASRTEPTALPAAGESRASLAAFKSQSDAPSCHYCGNLMMRNGACYRCANCGSTSGCS